ncbi:hypothetical protein [Corynebacterium terpenotabidum]|uniref:Uncharacterized protein n=1 Tax=Corynebacterium terpenotabidum Y-11 TaxID=1200352 RepID=S4X9A4_9CORY|nr:hypothetical protein [Corynebacterium terpenotabidum]AGP29687.1 hypothetical protein A606_00145 [Corynebacterium terpenotabidum Y-11]
MNTIPNTPLPANLSVADDHRRAYARPADFVRPTAYESRLEAIAGAWNVAPEDLLHKGYVDAKAEVEKVEAEIAEYAPVSLPDASVLREKNDAGRRKIINDTRAENEYRAQVRAELHEVRQSTVETLEANKAPELTFNHVMSVLLVAETAAKVRAMAKYLGAYSNHDVLPLTLKTGNDLRDAVAANAVIPEFRAGLNRLLMLDLLLPNPAEGYALFTDPGISGYLTFRHNVSNSGKVISTVCDWNTADEVTHKVAEDFREAFIGGFTDGIAGRRLSDNNQFSGIGSGDKTVTPLARGLIGDLTLDVAPSWDVLQDRLRRFSEANRKAEDRDNRFSADVFEDSESHILNRETGQYERVIIRRNLRDNSVQRITVGSTVPEPDSAPFIQPVRN